MCYLYRIYENNLVVHLGKVHDCIGINFDLSEKGKVKIDMIPLLENIFESFPEEIGATAKSPSRDNLFKIRDESEAVYFPEEQAAAFHHTTAQLLYIAPRRRRDIQTTVSF